MEFTLVYQGPLKANGSIKQKQAIRRAFHPQLKALWNLPPLNTYQDSFQENPPKNRTPILENVGRFTYAPLFKEVLGIAAEVNITLLRPETPGSIIVTGGDLDNRLKTLFDALRMPHAKSEIPKDDIPKENEYPFFCVLEDDNLITQITVKTDRLLNPSPNDNYVHLLIRIKAKKVKDVWFARAIA